MSTRFVGGVQTPYHLVASAGLVHLVATSDDLRFEFRFGLSRLVRPWVLLKQEITEVTLLKGRGLSWKIRILQEPSRKWEFFAGEAVARDAAARLRELGYPVAT